MNIPGTKMNTPILSDVDLESILKFVKGNPEVEFISLPHVRTANDVKMFKQALHDVDPDDRIKILSKI